MLSTGGAQVVTLHILRDERRSDNHPFQRKGLGWRQVTPITSPLLKSKVRAGPGAAGYGPYRLGKLFLEGHGFSRVPMSLRLTQGDENQGRTRMAGEYFLP